MNIRVALLLLVFGVPVRAFAEQKFALLAGVTTYSDARMNEKPLEYPEADATAIRDALEKSNYKVTLLVGREATRQAIQDALANIKQQGDRDGVLVLGFFGHGVQYGESAYFCPYDTKLREVMDKDRNILRYANGLPRQEPDPASMVSMREMLDTLAGSPTGSKLLLADCCREDPNVARGGLQGRAFGSTLQVSQLPRNCAALFACSEGEQAYEHRDWLHGAFTKALLTTLESGERITANGLSESLYLGVESLVKPKGETQRVSSIFSGGLVDLKIRRRTAEVGSGPGEVRELVPSLGMKFAWCPSGSFEMGSPASEVGRDEDELQHTVRLSEGFWLGQTEVTRGQFSRFVSATGYKTECERDGQGGYGVDSDGNFSQKPEYTWRNAGFSQTDDHPVVNVSWNDAVAFCEWLSRTEGKRFRLPTESEWEYACRAGTTSAYYNGDNSEGLTKIGNVADSTAKQRYPNLTAVGTSDGYVHTSPVGVFGSNRWNLHDMHGNVWEWCSDWYGPYSVSDVLDPQGAVSGSPRVNRGGSWYSQASLCRAAYRHWLDPSFRGSSLGFRLLLSPSAK